MGGDFIHITFPKHGVGMKAVTTQNEQLLAAVYLIAPYREFHKELGQMLIDGFDTDKYDEFEKEMYKKMKVADV